MNTNLAIEVAKILREKKGKSIKTIFWNQDRQDLSVFAIGYKADANGGNGLSFNYAPGPDATNEEVADYVAGYAQRLIEGKEAGDVMPAPIPPQENAQS